MTKAALLGAGANMGCRQGVPKDAARDMTT